MTIVTGHGSTGNALLFAVFLSDGYVITSQSDTSFTIANFNGFGSAVFTGSGFAYSGISLTAGTITGVSYTHPTNPSASTQTWSGFSVSAAAAVALGRNDSAGFNALFFSGDDTITFTTIPVFDPVLDGFDGNDVFNVSDWSKNGSYFVDGGNGNDTLNLTGGVVGTPSDFIINSNFNVSNVETVNLGAGANYTLILGPAFATAGNTVTVNGSNLGSSNRLVIDNDSTGPLLGNFVLIGGAGNDTFVPSLGSNVFNGGAGSDTVQLFYFGPDTINSGIGLPSGTLGFTIDLRLTTPQSLSTGAAPGGTATFIDIENLVGSPMDDRLTGNDGNNVFFPGIGNDVLDGRGGNDTVAYSFSRSIATIGHAGSTVTVSVGSFKTDTLTNIERLKFSDQTVAIGPVAPSDFDGSGSSDLVWQNKSGLVEVSLLDGATVQSSALVGSNPGPSWHIKDTGDFDGDGYTDLLWQNDNGQAAIWFMNGMTVSSTPLVGPNSGPSWHIKTTGDFNGDGKSDIVWQNDSGQVGIWLMDGATILSGPAVGPNPGPSWHVMGSGDFDGDAKSDLLWQSDSGQAAIWFMNGTSVISGPEVGPSLGGSLVIDAGDFDGDGRADILWQSTNGFTTVWLMVGSDIQSGSLGQPYLPNLGPSWHAKSAGDFNHDGKSDVLWQNDDGQAQVWLNNSTPFSGNSLVGNPLGSSWQIANNGTLAAGRNRVPGDFDGDGKSDILWQNDNGQVGDWWVNGTALVDARVIGPYTGPSWHIKGSSDFNGDGGADLLWQNDSGQAGIWLKSNSVVQGGPPVGGNPGPSWHIKGTGDFDDDGKSDLLWQNDNGQVGIWLMDGTTVLSSPAVGNNSDASWHVIGTGDFDGDGKSDILWQNDNGQAGLWMMNGTTVLSGPVAGGNPGPSWHVKGSGDFDGDGKADILWQSDNGQVGIWLMDGSTVRTSPAVGNNADPNWHVVGTGDFNGDGMSDILWQNSNGQAGVWLMSGTNVLTAGTVGANPGPSWHVIAGSY